jgi:hypothetical protein
MFGDPVRGETGEGRRAARCSAPACVRLVSGIAVVVAGWLAAFGAPTVLGQTVVDPRQEYNVKAVYLYSFGRYFLWPEETGTSKRPFTIGVFANDPFGDALKQIAQKKQIQGRPISIWPIEEIRQGESCQVVFVPKTVPAERQAAIIDALGRRPILLVGETPGFADRGGTANFFVDDCTVRFEINVDVAREQGLSIDAKLLNLARTVKGD